jgi:methylmalonyl-CoA/ethylmalonyl-CoA epimerase
VTVLPYNLHHVAIAVPDLDATLATFSDLFNVAPISREVIDTQGVEEAMIAIGGSHIQLLEPLTDDSPVGRFLARRGEGLHHLAFAVPDIEAAIDHLKTRGGRMVDESPRVGGGGSRIAFVHPSTVAGTLIELVEVDRG